MDRFLIEEKLEALRHCVQRLRNKCPEQAERLIQDEDLQDIIAINLARAVQLCVDIAVHIIAETDEHAPNTMAEAFEALHRLGVLSPTTAGKMKQAVGFRNIAVHSYEKIDWEIVQSICTHRLEDFREFSHSIVQAMERG
jgi:uncharacterized protein YutE (UPF0331/DUF86 family)